MFVLCSDSASEHAMDANAVTRDRAKRLREQMDLPERLLWKRLNRRQMGGLHFRRQHPIDPYILDFYCDAAKLAVEIDGYSHDAAGRAAHAQRRDLWLEEQWITVVRIAARDVLKAMEDVLATVELHLSRLRRGQAPSVASRQLPQRGSDSLT
jgi:very-short-patch-repair endonuclease